MKSDRAQSRLRHPIHEFAGALQHLRTVTAVEVIIDDCPFFADDRMNTRAPAGTQESGMLIALTAENYQRVAGAWHMRVTRPH